MTSSDQEKRPGELKSWCTFNSHPLSSVKTRLEIKQRVLVEAHTVAIETKKTSLKLNLLPPAGVMSSDCYFQLNLPV